jgi:hypothetical protein
LIFVHPPAAGAEPVDDGFPKERRSGDRFDFSQRTGWSNDTVAASGDEVTRRDCQVLVSANRHT